MKKFKKSLAKRKLHTLWSLKVRQRDEYYCQWCLFDGKYNKNLRHHAHHIVSRALSRTAGAFEVVNGMTLCYSCHMFRLKSEVDEYIEFRNRWLSVDYYTLRAKYEKYTKFTEEFYRRQERKLKKSTCSIR